MYFVVEIDKTVKHYMQIVINMLFIFRTLYTSVNHILCAVLFFLKEGSGMHSHPKFGQRSGFYLYRWQRKKVSECRNGLSPSEKELLEWNSGTFHHKNTPNYV